MEYNLSQKNDNQKKQYESIIEQNDKKWLKLAEEIKNIRAGKEGRTKDGQFAILELQIQQEEIERDTDTKKEAIADLYVREMKENLIQRERNKEISASEFANEIRKIREYKSMISTKNSIEYYDKEEIIIEMKLRLEHMKKSMGKVPKEQADKKIAEMKQTLSDNEEYRQDEVDDLAKQNFEYKRKNLYYQRNSGEISKDELKQKLEELEQIKGKIPTNEEFKEMLTDLSEKHLEQPQQSQEYEREVSKQDINKCHKHLIYRYTQDYDNKVLEYFLQTLGGRGMTHADSMEYVVERLGEEYARGAKGEKAEMAKQFAMLEVQGKNDDFTNIYNFKETKGYDNPKLLLQLEKVNGLNIEELEDIIGLDTSPLHQDIFVATYEINEYDHALKESVLKPIKEYYQRDKNGDFNIIGTGTEHKTTFVIDGMSFNVDTDQVLQGDSLEKITQREMSDRLIKNGIEDSLKSGKVTKGAKLTDDLVNAYENARINQEDMNKAYERLNRTKAEREQSHNQTETDKFRDR